MAVVQCPACRGASRVSLEAIGQMVACPRCQTPFVAEEDIPVVQPVARANPSAAPAVPVAPARRRRRLQPLEDEPEPPPRPTAPEVPDPEHDPHARPVAGLPVSVLVGLALLPFGIPLLWRVAPFLTRQEAQLSLAVPVCLAIAVSALCLGVVYTIDWTAATRIKGVLMLVGLSYLSAAGLFFLKKDLMDRVRAWGDDTERWRPMSVKSKDYHFDVSLRGQQSQKDLTPAPKPLPLPSMKPDGNYTAFYKVEDGPSEYRYFVAWGKGADKQFKPDDEWFARVRDHLKANDPGVSVTEPDALNSPGPPGVGRQWTFTLTDGTVRVVRVYVVNGRVYYLSAEGLKLQPDDDDHVTPFFQSFRVHR